MNSLYMLVAAAVGTGLAVQAAVNAQLRVAADSVVWAALISAAVTVLLLCAAQLYARDPLAVAQLARLPWWIWIGGLLGAAYVVAIAALTRTLGVAVFFVALVTGQLVGGLLIDHFGWFNAPVRPISPARVAGVLLLLAGVGLMRWR